MPEMPSWAASTQALQWVVPAGLVFRVVSRTLRSSSGVRMRRDQLRFCGAQILAAPCLANAARLASPVARDKPVCWAIESLATPWLANKMTGHPRTIHCGVAPSRSKDSNCRFCPSSIVKAAAGTNMPPLHYGLQLLLIIITDQC